MIATWIQWVEIPVYNFDKAKHFYETLFQVELKTLDLGAVTMALFPETLTAGALVQGEWYHPSEQGVILHVGVINIEYALSQVVLLGGSVVQPKKQISTELGYMALIRDCEGNRLALRAQS